MACNRESLDENSSEESDECFDQSFLPYDEAAQYRIEKAIEGEEEQRILSRF